MIQTCNRSSEMQSFLLQHVYSSVDSIETLRIRIVGRLSDSSSTILAVTSHHFSLNEDKYWMNRKIHEAKVYAPIQIAFSFFHAHQIDSNRYSIR